MQAKERSYETMVNFGKQGLSIAATAAVSAAVKASCPFPLKWIIMPFILFAFVCKRGSILPVTANLY